jgi:hypothetical protein
MVMLLLLMLIATMSTMTMMTMLTMTHMITSLLSTFMCSCIVEQPLHKFYSIFTMALFARDVCAGGPV